MKCENCTGTAINDGLCLRCCRASSGACEHCGSYNCPYLVGADCPELLKLFRQLEEDESFLHGPTGETSAQTIARWRKGQKILNARLQAGQTPTKELADWLDFVTQKMDDWESDYDVQP